MSDHVYMYDALHITPPIPDSEIAPLIADGTYVKVWNDDPRGEPGYLARRPDAVVGVFVCAHLAEDGSTTQSANTIEVDNHLEFTEKERFLAAVIAEIAQLMADFHTADDGLVRLFDNVIAYESNTYVGPGLGDYMTTEQVIAIRNGRPVCLSEKAWRDSIA